MKPRRIFTQLGRTGDIINILPLLFREYQKTGIKPILQVAVEFASILEGVSYVDPLIWYGPWDHPMLAMREARQLSPDITLCQIHGANLCNPNRCDSFARESWLSAGADVPWGSLPLVFDRRDIRNERDLINPAYFSLAFDVVLVATVGKSSPFPHGKALIKTLREKLNLHKFAVIDLGEVKAKRFFDMLGLYERAHCLVTIDTAHQHLAAACPHLPVVALCTRDPSGWHGSPWRPQQVARFYYDEFPMVMNDVVQAVMDARLPQPKIIHVWADWRTNPNAESNRRQMNAAISWQTEYDTGRWIPREMKREDATRDGTDIGDPHNVNFVHDTIEFAVKVSTNPKDIIALTNADSGFTPGLTGRILEQVRRHNAVFTHRRDHKRIEAPFVSEAQAREGEWYPGTDAFFFTVEWWEQHKSEYADFLMGREGWDEVLRQLVKYHAGGYIPHAIWHEWHESSWCGEGRWTMPGNLHNFRLRDEWFAKTGFVQEDFRYFRVVEHAENHPKPYPAEPLRGP